MKQRVLLLLFFFLLAGAGAKAQAIFRTDTIKVYGNCDMCKKKIEGALTKKDGVVAKNWDKSTGQLVVTYDTAKINPQEIGKKVAAVGYDNEYATAPDAVYSKLHTCCKYQRPKKQ